MEIIDLSATIKQTPEDAPPYEKIDIEYHDHDAGAEQVEMLLKVPKNLLKNKEGWATETLSFMTHNTTHLDAPWHYNSKIKNEKAMSIDELPLEWFFNDGVVLDMTHKKQNEPVSINDLKDTLKKINYQLKDKDIVLIYSGMDKYYGEADYIFKGCGVSLEATKWLYNNGIKVMGIDSWGWDAPLNFQAEKAIKKDSAGIFWSAHQADLQYVHMERLVNLAALPATGFKISCFPLKIKNGSAGPARVVAILE